MGIPIYDNNGKVYVFESPVMQDLMKKTLRIAATDARVIITGETGAGKEYISYLLYNNSRRRDKPFLTVNTGGLPESLLESELFGYMAGSFTGSRGDKPGILQQADKGTIYFDEIELMPMRLQGMLLRFLDTGEL